MKLDRDTVRATEQSLWSSVEFVLQENSKLYYPD